MGGASPAEQNKIPPRIIVVSRFEEWARTVSRAFEVLRVPVAAYSEDDAEQTVMNGFGGLLVYVEGPQYQNAAARVQAIRNLGKRCPIMVLCSDKSAEAAAALLEAGADDYVALPFNGRELIARASALIRRSSDQWIIPGSGTSLEIDVTHRIVRIGKSEAKLTPTEFSIFQYLASRRGTWVSSNTIISDVIGTHHAPRTALVRVHVHHIRRKLGDAGWCLRAEHGRGYMLSV